MVLLLCVVLLCFIPGLFSYCIMDTILLTKQHYFDKSMLQEFQPYYEVSFFYKICVGFLLYKVIHYCSNSGKIFNSENVVH